MSQTSPLPNDPAARTPTGELKQASTLLTPEPKTEPKVEAKVEPTAKTDSSNTTEKEGETSLLNEGQLEKKAEPEVKAEDKDKKEPEKAKAEGVPEKYELKAPEGFELDEGVVKEASEMFKKMNLNNAQAQELVDFYAKKALEAAEAPVKYYSDMRQQWRKDIAADKEIGHKLPEVKATVAKAIDSLGALAAPFREAMDLTGAGDNPAFIKAFFAIAQQLTEGTHVGGNGPSKFGQGLDGKRPSLANAMYPNLPS